MSLFSPTGQVSDCRADGEVQSFGDSVINKQRQQIEAIAPMSPSAGEKFTVQLRQDTAGE